MGVSLNPGDARPEHIAPREPRFLIEGLLPACGVTVLATENDTDRRRLMLQFCAAVQSGRMLFDQLQVEQGEVVFVATGEGERSRAEEIADVWSVTIPMDVSKPQLPSHSVEKILEENPNARLLVIVNIQNQRPPFSRWMRRYLGLDDVGKLLESVKYSANTLGLQELRRKSSMEFISTLLKLTSERRVAILLGHSLTSTGKLYDRGSLQGVDDVLTLSRNRATGTYVFKTEWEGATLSRNEHQLTLETPRDQFRLSDESRSYAAQQAAATGNPQRQLTRTERVILDALQEHGPLSHTQIVQLRLPSPNSSDGSPLAGSTVSNRLKALQGESKGRAVIKLEDVRYQINP